jgi:hypothetical protein
MFRCMNNPGCRPQIFRKYTAQGFGVDIGSVSSGTHTEAEPRQGEGQYMGTSPADRAVTLFCQKDCRRCPLIPAPLTPYSRKERKYAGYAEKDHAYRYRNGPENP